MNLPSPVEEQTPKLAIFRCYRTWFWNLEFGTDDNGRHPEVILLAWWVGGGGRPLHPAGDRRGSRGLDNFSPLDGRYTILKYLNFSSK